MIRNALVRIVYCPQKKKPRARYEGGWVRFPRDLRTYGHTYQVDLKAGREGSWIACGEIKQVKNE